MTPAADPSSALPDLQLLDQDSFYPALDAAGSALVVVDFYTDW